MASTDARPIPSRNTAYRVTFPIFDADGDLVSGASGLDSEVSGDGGSFADCTNEATEIATNSGIYYLDLTASEMNYDTVAIIIKTSTSGAKTTPIILYPAETTDIPVNVTAISGDTAAADNAEADFDGTGYTHTNSQMPGLSATETQIDNLESRLTATRAGYLDNLSAGAVAQASVLGIPAGASIAADIADVHAHADAAHTDSHATAAKLPSKLYLTGTGNADGDVDMADATGNYSGAVGSVTGAVGSVTAGVTVATNTDKSGYTLSAAGLQAIWDVLTSALTTVGSIGKLLVDRIDAAISSRLATAGYTPPPSAASNADAVWDEALTDHLGGGSTGAALNAAGSAGDPWATALPGAYGSGTAGNIIGNRLNVAVSTRSSHSAADVWSSATRTLTASGDPTAAAIADAVWDEATAGHTGAGSAGQALLNANNGTPPAANAIADAVWDEILAGHAGAGSTGAALAGASAPTASVVADAVWDEILAGHAGAGSAGLALAGAGGTLGPGAAEFVYTLTDANTGLPISGADTWVTTDIAGLNIVARSFTDNFGNISFWLDPGTYYFWRQRAGYAFVNPDTEIVT